MYYNFYKTAPSEYDEYISKGVYSVSPVLTSLQEVLLVHLRELAFYLLRLRKMGINNSKIKEEIIDDISTIIMNVNYSQLQFQVILTKLTTYLNQAKALYFEYCEKNGIKAESLKTHFKHQKNLNIKSAIKKGEKYVLKKFDFFTDEQKKLFDLMLLLVKSMCIRIIQIRSYSKDYEEAYSAMLDLLDTMNFHQIEPDGIKTRIKDFIGKYYKLIDNLHQSQEERFGGRETTHISFSPIPGKAILVSGVDLTLLEAVLKATVNKGIHVYTHGLEMLMAHTLEKIRAYPNLVGHFGKGDDNCMIDFSKFPGAILTTKILYQQIDYLFRGRLFTTDLIAPYGVTKIENHNFEPLIEAALESKGFVKKYPPQSLRVGFNDEKLTQRVHDVLDLMEKNEIKHLYIIGLLNYEGEYKKYFHKFMDLMPKDCHVLSLAYEREEANVEHVDSFFDYSSILQTIIQN